MQELNNSLKEALSDLFSMFGIEYELLQENEEEKLKCRDEEINVILGLAGNIKGNIILGCTNNIAFQIVSGMLGGMEVSKLDEMVISGIGEFVNMLGGSAVTKLDTCSSVDITPPTVITSSGSTMISSQLHAHTLNYSLGGEKLAIAYCIKSAEGECKKLLS